MFKKVHVVRLSPGQEVMTELKKYCEKEHVTSGAVLCMIGSFEGARLGIPPARTGGSVKFEAHQGNVYDWKVFEGPFSVISGLGNIALMGKELVFHIHVMLNAGGNLTAGHLSEAKVWATLEVVIGELGVQLERVLDKSTGTGILQSIHT